MASRRYRAKTSLNSNVSQINAQVSQTNKRPAPRRIAENAISAAAIQPNAVIQEAIADGAVGSKQISADAILTASIKDLAVTDPKIVTLNASKLTGTMNSTISINTASLTGSAINVSLIPDLAATKITSGTFPTTGVTVPASIISGTVANANVSARVSNAYGNGTITISSSNPSGGSSGDIWIKIV